MRQYANVITAYAIMIALIILVGIFQSWNVALAILNFCLISAVMTMGANIQWGYAGLINFGIITLFHELNLNYTVHEQATHLRNLS